MLQDSFVNFGNFANFKDTAEIKNDYNNNMWNYEKFVIDKSKF